MKNLVEVGKVGRKVGLKGFCKLHLTSDFPQFLTKNRVLIGKKGLESKELTIDSFSEDRGEIKFVGVNNPEDASLLTHTILYTTIDETKEAIELEEDELFWFDLIGVEAYENGKFIGTVSAIDDRVELFISIKLDSGFNTKQKDLIIPWSDRFVASANKERLELVNVLEIIDAL